jgi:hypothetical protein
MSVVDVSTNVSDGIGILKSRGVTILGRYYSSRSWKRLTKYEAKLVSENGLKLFTVFEDDGDPELTEDQGVHHAQMALAQAQQVGQPKGSAIYFALEHLPHGYNASHIDGVVRYVTGLRSVLNGHYKVGVYSDGVICAALLDRHLAEFTWLSASTSFPGTKDFYASDRWSVAQRKVDLDWDGLSVDTNEAKNEIGAFSTGVTPEHPAMGMTLSADRNGGDAARIPELIKIGSAPESIRKVQGLAKKTMAGIGYVYPRKSCAATLSHFLREAGIDIPVTTGAQNLADRLRNIRRWSRIANGGQQPGDVGVCFSHSDDVPGADHIYLVISCQGDDELTIADNQVQGATHTRYVSGKGNKTPTEYFLRASGSTLRLQPTAGEVEADEGIWPDEATEGLPEPFMDDGTPRAVD